MRYSKLLDRTLYAISLLHQGDQEASAAVLAEALEDPDFEGQFVALNDEIATAHRASVLEDDSDPQDTTETASEEDTTEVEDLSGWEEVLNDDEPETATVSEEHRRTEMMLANLKKLRG